MTIRKLVPILLLALLLAAVFLLISQPRSASYLGGVTDPLDMATGRLVCQRIAIAVTLPCLA